MWIDIGPRSPPGRTRVDGWICAGSDSSGDRLQADSASVTLTSAQDRMELGGAGVIIEAPPRPPRAMAVPIVPGANGAPLPARPIAGKARVPSRKRGPVVSRGGRPWRLLS